MNREARGVELKHVLKRTLGCCLLLLVTTAALGQARLQDFFYTAATTTTNASGTHWAYLLWDSTTPGLVIGSQYSIYHKSGDPASPNLYQRLAVVQRQTDPRVITALLNRASNLGENASELNDSINKLFQTMTGAMALPLAEKISAVIRGSAGNPAFESNLRLLAKIHPGMSMSLGLAHAEIIPGPVGTTNTFEIRQYDPSTRQDVGVVGRVTVVAGQPPVLPPPGPPVRLPEYNPRGHLNAKLRWSAPDDLRRLSLLNYGFNVWRLTRSVSEANSIGTNAPLLAKLLMLKASRPNEVIQVNHMAVLPSRNFDFRTVADFSPATGNTNMFFLADDNDRFRGGTNFKDGEEFYYYVTARDLLGRDGAPSPGTLVKLCSLLPPGAPTGLSVANDYSYPGTPKQVLKVSWRQTENSPMAYTNSPRTNIVAYYVYRWSNQVEMLANEPYESANRIAIVPHLLGTNTGSYIDDGANSPAMPADAGKTFWYTVRALDGGACTNLLSPHSGMAYGVLRDRVGPPPPIGGIVINCPNAIAAYLDRREEFDPDADPANSHFLLQCSRLHSQLAWAEFKVHVNTNDSTAPLAPSDYDLGRIEFGPDNNALIDYALPGFWKGAPVTVSCRVGASDQIISPWISTDYQTWPGTGNRLTLLFNGRIDVNSTPVDGPMPVRLRPPIFFSLPPVVNDTYVVLYTPGVSSGVGRVQASRDMLHWTDLTKAPITTITVPFIGTYGPFFAFLDPAIFNEPQRFYRVLPASYTVPVPCQHFPYPGNNTDGTNTEVEIAVGLTPTTKEYKIYRRVDDGALTLLAQGRGDYEKTNVIIRKDEALPAGASKLCYFAQVFDEHGNPSPLTPLGDCVTPNRVPPCPVLSSIEPVFTNSNPMALVRWACPIEGAERFKIYVSLKQGQPIQLIAENVGGNELGYTGLNANLAKQLQTSASLDTMGHVVRPKETYTGSYPTDRVGGSIGTGPQFSILINVAEGTDYLISIRAVGPGGAESRNCLPARRFTWNPPPSAPGPGPAVPQVAWPARPLPPTTSSNIFTAELMPMGRLANPSPPLTLADLDPVHPVGIKIGSKAGIGRWVCDPNTTNNVFPGLNLPTGFLFQPPQADPASPRTVTDLVLPLVLYRTQVSNPNFPSVSGDIVQASPLIEKIAYRVDTNVYPCVVTSAGTGTTVLVDPFMRPLYHSQTIDRELRGYADIYLLDTQPVLAGATYHYMLVRFDPLTREVDQTISAGTVTIPSN